MKSYKRARSVHCVQEACIACKKDEELENNNIFKNTGVGAGSYYELIGQ